MSQSPDTPNDAVADSRAIGDAQAVASLPASPVLSWSGAWQGRRGDVPCILDGTHAAFVRSGRMAIALALQQMQLAPGEEVLIPAYHCPTMIYPVVWAGAKPRFYRIREDLSVDMDDLARRIGERSRVVMAAHFFGFPKDLSALRQLCDQHGLLLLEDCAHAFFGGTKEHPIGSQGDYAISSLLKFFPVIDGGCLVSRSRRPDKIALRRQGAVSELRSALNAFEKSISYGRLSWLAPLLKPLIALKDRLLAPKTGSDTEPGSESAETENPQRTPAWHKEFPPGQVGQQMSRFSRTVVALASYRFNVERRKRNYLMLRDAFEGIPGARALYPELPPGVVPYAFPLLMEQPDPAFQRLRSKGLPVFRWHDLWEGVDEQDFPVSSYYGRHLIQVACHQELTEQDMCQLVEHVAEAIRSLGE